MNKDLRKEKGLRLLAEILQDVQAGVLDSDDIDEKISELGSLLEDAKFTPAEEEYLEKAIERLEELDMMDMM